MNSFYNKNETYDIPITSGYFKFEDGDNRFRILGAFSEKTAIQGIEYWKTIEGKRKPIRLTKDKSVPVEELEINKYGDTDRPRFFWAFPVWNYQEKKVQILEITQVTILKSLKKYIENSKWGDPRDYDIIVNRSKNGEKTEYTLTVDPKEKLDKAIIDEYINTYIDMTALFRSEDPYLESDAGLADDAVKAGL